MNKGASLLVECKLVMLCIACKDVRWWPQNSLGLLWVLLISLVSLTDFSGSMFLILMEVLEKFFDGSWKHDNQECVHGMLWEEFSLHGSHLVMMLKLGAYMHVKIICMVLMHSKCMLRILTCIVLFHAKVHSQWGLHR